MTSTSNSPAEPSSPDSVRLLRLLTDNREAIMQVATNRGATNLRVFGSVAAGTSEEGSDIDLLVDFPNQDSGQQFMNAGGLSVELEELLGVRVDVLVLNHARHKVAESICAGRVIVL